MATNERPLSCASCVFGPLSTSNSLNNLSGRRNSLLNTIDEEQSLGVQSEQPLLMVCNDSPSSSASSFQGVVVVDEEEEKKHPLTRSMSAPELYSDSFISDSVSLELVADGRMSSCEVSPPSVSISGDSMAAAQKWKARFFRGNKSMSVDATAVAAKESRSLLSHLTHSSFLAHILNPFMPRIKHQFESPLICRPVTPLQELPEVSLSRDRIPEEECAAAAVASALPSVVCSPGSLVLEDRKKEEAENKKRKTAEDEGDFSVFCATPNVLSSSRSCHPLPNVVTVVLPNNSSSTTTAPSTTTARRPRHSFAGQMNFSKFWSKMPTHTSTNSLFSTAVITGSSSAPNLRDALKTASPSGKARGLISASRP